MNVATNCQSFSTSKRMPSMCYILYGPAKQVGSFKLLKGMYVRAFLIDWEICKHRSITGQYLVHLLERYQDGLINRAPFWQLPNDPKLPANPDPYYYSRVRLIGKHPDYLTAERLVIGKSGEVYYTADHYQTFTRVTY